MAKPSRATQAKRSRELAKQERQQAKREDRARRKEQRADRAALAAAGEDPDLIGIVAGPQPRTDADPE
jgi:hypothetical protein